MNTYWKPSTSLASSHTKQHFIPTETGSVERLKTKHHGVRPVNIMVVECKSQIEALSQTCLHYGALIINSFLVDSVLR